MSELFVYPAPEEGESGADYWERVRQLGLPFPWEADRSLPPGKTEVTEGWATKDSNGAIWPYDEATVKHVAATVDKCVIMRRVVWVSAGLWEEVKEGD